MKLFRKRKKKYNSIDERYQMAIELIKDLDKSEFNKLMDGLNLAWQGYDRIRKVQTRDEKENKSITEAEKFIEEDMK